MVIYNKYIESKNNLLNIKPLEPEQIYFYYLGIFQKINSGIEDNEYIELDRTYNGSGFSEYFPLIIKNLNFRGNWKCLTTNDAFKIHHIDFSWCNASIINSKSTVVPRILLDSINHYISDKYFFYDKFKEYDFIPKFIKFNNICDLDLFNNKSIIIKPTNKSQSLGILIQKNINIPDLLNHINKFNSDEWIISEYILPKLINNYITSVRFYLLVIKENNQLIKSYYYKIPLINSAHSEFNNDITDPLQTLSNYIDIQLGGEYDFINRRSISFDSWKSNFSTDIFNSIINKYINIFTIIIKTMKNDILAHNDNKIIFENSNLNNKNVISFHLYGIDSIIDNDNNIKILEINGSPSINIRSEYYNIKTDINNSELINEVLQKTLDKIYPPKNNMSKLNNFIKFFEDTKLSNNVLYYIPNSITKTYPFILYALKKRPYLQRTKNLHDNIDIFYGLRERYITDLTNLNYYDELINYLTSKRMRNANIINKIQGITYYLANKSNIYVKLLDKYPSKIVHEFHPVSQYIYFNNDLQKLEKQIKTIIKNINYNKIIIKPVHGSKGKDICILSKNNNKLKKIFNNFCGIKFTDMLVGQIIKHITKTNQDGIIEYKHWLISQYIDNPHLLKLSGDLFGRKYNIRFYVLLTINKNLPTHKDISNNINEYDYMTAYLLNDFLLYFAMLEYNQSDLPEKYKYIDKNIYFDKMKNLTNLEIINQIALYLKNLNINFDSNAEKLKLTKLLSDIYPKHSFEFDYIKCQAKSIIEKTINAVKYDLRPLNRFTTNFKGCFNLLAYDSLLDDTGKLWFIEVNRGPDMIGLLNNLGFDNCTNLFDEIFNLTIDKHYNIDEYKLNFFEKIPIKYNIYKYLGNNE